VDGKAIDGNLIKVEPAPEKKRRRGALPVIKVEVQMG
jgi:hypothetical protein